MPDGERAPRRERKIRRRAERATDPERRHSESPRRRNREGRTNRSDRGRERSCSRSRSRPRSDHRDGEAAEKRRSPPRARLDVGQDAGMQLPVSDLRPSDGSAAGFGSSSSGKGSGAGFSGSAGFGASSSSDAFFEGSGRSKKRVRDDRGDRRDGQHRDRERHVRHRPRHDHGCRRHHHGRSRHRGEVGRPRGHDRGPRERARHPREAAHPRERDGRRLREREGLHARDPRERTTPDGGHGVHERAHLRGLGRANGDRRRFDRKRGDGYGGEYGRGIEGRADGQDARLALRSLRAAARRWHDDRGAARPRIVSCMIRAGTAPAEHVDAGRWQARFAEGQRKLDECCTVLEDACRRRTPSGAVAREVQGRLRELEHIHRELLMTLAHIVGEERAARFVPVLSEGGRLAGDADALRAMLRRADAARSARTGKVAGRAVRS